MTTVSLLLSFTLLPIVLLATFISLESGRLEPQPMEARRRRRERGARR